MEPVIKGLTLVPNYITRQQHDALLAVVDGKPWQKVLTRRTQQYGYHYNYAAKEANVPTTPIPHEFEELIETFPVRPDQCIVNEYLPGQGIGMHTDHPGYFDNVIVSISLGSAIVMDFDLPRAPVAAAAAAKTSVVLPPCSALFLQDDARWQWRHGIAGRKQDPPPVGKRGRRVSLTFRKMKK